MQRHTTAAAYALLVGCAFGASVLPAAAQTTTRIEREVREELRGERDLRGLDATVAGRTDAPNAHPTSRAYAAAVV